jgi:2-aminoethylphosphonate-pyruvate transaminase
VNLENAELADVIPQKTLFTPGPLTTSATVKAAMLRDLGSRDAAFIAIVRELRRALVAEVAGASPDVFTAVPMQGSGTFAVEAAVGSVVPRGGRLLVVENGAYGRRIVEIARRLGIETDVVSFPERRRPDPAAIEAALARAAPAVVAAVHLETSTGMRNPIEEIGRVVRRVPGARFVVDAMSSFGGLRLSLEEAGIDYLVSSANKCLEGVPGLGFVIARRAALEATEGFARSVSLDLLAQWRELERSGQFRFTPPVHVVLALRQAVRELFAEGGVAGRAARYRRNFEALRRGMRELGFREYLDEADQGYVITAFHCPPHPRFRFAEFYERLSERGLVIYPGKVGDADCFRVGTIGRIDTDDVAALLDAIRAVLAEMEVAL